jgi:hypothetical protein
VTAAAGIDFLIERTDHLVPPSVISVLAPGQDSAPVLKFPRQNGQIPSLYDLTIQVTSLWQDSLGLCEKSWARRKTRGKA